MLLNFSNKKYLNEAYNVLSNNVNDKVTLSNIDCFLLLLQGLKFEDLSNLCNALSNKLNISCDEAYTLTQSIDTNPFKDVIFSESLDIILNGNYLGSAVDGVFNTSGWISHSVHEAILAYNLAAIMNLNRDFAFNYGLLHDYGRKYCHNFQHVIKGFEELINLGIVQESRACLTHSFIRGGRYCNMEVASDEFYVDDNGVEHYDEKDDICDVLGKSNYSIYDDIVNVADLMAMSSGVVSPEERIKDVLTRRNNLEESSNWPYFLASFCNLLIDMLDRMKIQHAFKKINYREYDIDRIKELLSSISNCFYTSYNDLILKDEYSCFSEKTNLKK